MSRGIALNLLASGLTILAAIAFLGAVAIVGDGSRAAPMQAQSAPVIWTFYAAVNEALRSGETASLDAILTPDLRFHASPPAPPANRSDFYHHLAALRTSAPSTQLNIQELTTAGTQAVARITATSGEPAEFLGLRPTTTVTDWASTDAFRVEAGRIVELWSTAPAPVALEPMAALDFRAPLPGPQSLALERLSAPPGMAWQLGPFAEPRIVFVSAGAMTVAIDTTARLQVLGHDGQFDTTDLEPGTVLSLESGDVGSIPAGTEYHVRQDSRGRGVTAFAVVAPRFSYNGPQPPQARHVVPDDAGRPHVKPSLTNLADASWPPLAQEAKVSFGRLTLAARQSIAFAAASGPAFVVVESGALAMSTGNESPSLMLVASKEARLLAPGTTLSLSNVGNTPARLIVATILPIARSAEPQP